MALFRHANHACIMSDYFTQPDPGTRILRRCDELAAISRPGSGVTRLYLTGEHRAAMELVSQWMRAAGMTVHIDQAANVIGRYPSANGKGPALLMGSHIDSVIDAGKYDGPLGVIAAIDCVATLHRQGRHLAFGIEILAFGDEEGTRFGTTLIGSRAVAGTLNPQDLAYKDRDNITVETALRTFGLDPATLASAIRKKDDVLAYVELHIEQGPVLEGENLAVGVVTSISAQTRKNVILKSAANHAGTVPMRLRHDPFLAAAEIALALEKAATAIPDAVGTIGQVDVRPGASNVIPGRVTVSLDMRARTDAMLKQLTTAMDDEIARIAAARGVGLAIEPTLETKASPCSARLIEQFDNAIGRSGLRPLHLPSGAGHDGMAMSVLGPIAMLFVRCKGGVSHSPLESVTAEDVTIAADVLRDFIENFVSERS
jgi:allantoate deiminase